VFRHLSLIIQREFYATLQRKVIIFFMFGIPILFALFGVIVYQFNQSATAKRLNDEINAVESISPKPAVKIIGLVDEANLMESLPPGMTLVDTYKLYATQSAALADLELSFIDGVLIIPADYAQGAHPQFYTNKTSLLSNWVDNEQIGVILAYNLLAKDPALAQVALSPMEIQVTELESSYVENNALDSSNWYVSMLPTFMVFLLYMVILIPSGNLVSGLTDEKKNRVMEVLLCTVSPMQLFVGKLLATGFLGLVQMLLWMGLVWVMGKYGGSPLRIPEGFTVPTSLLLWAIVYALLGYMMYAAQLAGVGALAPNASESRSVTIFLMLPLIVAYMLSAFISIAPYSTLAYFLSYFPLTAPVAMVGRMAAVTLPVWEPPLSALSQLVGVLVIVRIFGRLFNANLMLSGQTLNLKRFVIYLIGKN